MPPRRPTVRVAVPAPPRTTAFPRSFLVLTETRVFPAMMYVLRVSTLCTASTPQRPPSRVRMPDSFRCLAIDLTPIDPEEPFPSRTRRKISRTVSCLDRIDLQCLLLGAVAALLGGFHDAVANRR